MKQNQAKLTLHLSLKLSLRSFSLLTRYFRINFNARLIPGTALIIQIDIVRPNQISAPVQHQRISRAKKLVVWL